MSNPPPGMASAGLSAPPGLSGAMNHNYANMGGNAFPQQQQMQQQQIQQQPDLSQVGPHTTSAQLASILAAAAGGNNEPNPFSSASSQQHQFNNGAQFPSVSMQQPNIGGFGGLGSNAFSNPNFGGGMMNNSSFGGGGGSGGMGGAASQPHPCRMHQQGGCRYGAACRFQHIGPAGSGTGGMSGGNSFGGNQFGGMGGGGAQYGRDQQFGGGQQTFPQQPQQQPRFDQQPQRSPQPSAASHDQLDASAVGGFNPNVPAFVPGSSSSSSSAAANPNGSSAPNATNSQQQQQQLLSMLMQQQLGGGASPEMENLILSLNKSLNIAAIPSDPSNLNNEFLQAQAALNSLARPNTFNANGPPQQQNFGGNRNSSPFQNNQQQQFGGNKPSHQHSHHGSSFNPSFHAGGNFGATNPSALMGAAAPQMRFFADPSNRDQRREVELFGPAHTTTTGINFDKYDEIPVEVTGNDIPGEMKAFSDFDFPEVITQNIKLAKYEKPTPIQKFALPIAFLGRDLMACAQTGSGKTAAFLLPFIAFLMINGRPSPQGGSGRNRRYMPVGLVLAPTRELATQIHEESLKFTYCTNIHSVVVYGGQDIRQQFRELDRGCDILVATPGRLMDFVERGRISLAQISYLCLDEADRMLDMGFEPQIRNIVLQQDMTENRQTLMFSATFPKEIQRLAGDFLYNYAFIAVGRVGASSDLITQSIEWVNEEDKRNQLMQHLPKFKGLTLIFVERKKSADLLETYLNQKGYHASSIHGDRSQHERESALMQFRNGRCPILVATDVAARGLDIPNVLDVVNFDMPNTIDDYVHRIGRTGRAGNTGNAWSFANEKASHMFKELYEMMIENKQVVPQWLSSAVETRGGGGFRGGMGGGGGGRGGRFGARDFRKGGQGYGSHQGGRGSMAQHSFGKRFQGGPGAGNGAMFPNAGASSSGSAGGFQQQQQQGGFAAAAASSGASNMRQGSQQPQQGGGGGGGFGGRSFPQ